MPSHMKVRLFTTAVAVAGLLACRSASQQDPSGRTWPQQLAFAFARQPDSAPPRWLGLIGEYGPDTTKRWYALERDRRMYVLDQYGNYVPLSEKNDSMFDSPRSTALVS